LEHYNLNVAPIEGNVTGSIGETRVVETGGARIMWETRLPPTVYFPKSALVGGELSKNGFRTFCPFKGTATYWDLHVNGEVLEKAAWSYERALIESRDIEGMIGFMPGCGISLTSPGLSF